MANTYNISDVCKKLKMTRTAVYNNIRKGIIATQRDEKGRHYVTEETLQDVMNKYHMNENVFTCGEVKEMLGIKRIQTISDYCNSGYIKSYRLPSGLHVIPEDEVKKLKAMKETSGRIK